MFSLRLKYLHIYEKNKQVNNLITFQQERIYFLPVHSEVEHVESESDRVRLDKPEDEPAQSQEDED